MEGAGSEESGSLHRRRWRAGGLGGVGGRAGGGGELRVFVGERANKRMHPTARSAVEAAVPRAWGGGLWRGCFHASALRVMRGPLARSILCA